MFANVTRQKAKQECEVSAMRRVVTDDERNEIRLLVVIRQMIKLLRQDDISWRISSPNVSKSSVGNMVIWLGKTKNASILVFKALKDRELYTYSHIGT